MDPVTSDPNFLSVCQAVSSLKPGNLVAIYCPANQRCLVGRFGRKKPAGKKNKGSRKYHMSVSKDRGTPKWMVYNGKPYKNWWFGGTPIFGNTHIGEASVCYLLFCFSVCVFFLFEGKNSREKWTILQHVPQYVPKHWKALGIISELGKKGTCKWRVLEWQMRFFFFFTKMIFHDDWVYPMPGDSSECL